MIMVTKKSLIRGNFSLYSPIKYISGASSENQTKVGLASRAWWALLLVRCRFDSPRRHKFLLLWFCMGLCGTCSRAAGRWPVRDVRFSFRSRQVFGAARAKVLARWMFSLAQVFGAARAKVLAGWTFSLAQIFGAARWTFSLAQVFIRPGRIATQTKHSHKWPSI